MAASKVGKVDANLNANVHVMGMECYELAKRIVLMKKLGASLPAILKSLKISHDDYQLIIPAVNKLQIAANTVVPPPEPFPLIQQSNK